MSGIGLDLAGRTPAIAETTTRMFVTPRARKFARDRKLNLALVRGSGPRGRIIAADVESGIETPSRGGGVRVAAMRTRIDFAAVEMMLASFATRGLDIDLSDVVVRSASVALASAVALGGGSMAAIALELPDRNVEIASASTMALSDIHAARLLNSDHASEPFVTSLSIRVLEPDGIAPVFLHPLPGFEMRLAIAAASTEGIGGCAMLSFDEGRVTIETASAVLDSLRHCLQQPLLML